MNTKESRLEAQGYGQVFGGEYAGCWHKGGRYYRFDGNNLNYVGGLPVAEADRTTVVEPEPESNPPGGSPTPIGESREEIIAKLLNEHTDDEIYAMVISLSEKLKEQGTDISADILAPEAGDETRTSGKINAEIIADHVAKG